MLHNQTNEIKAALLKTAIENPNAQKHEIMDLVAKQMDIPIDKRPSIRRCKANLITELQAALEVLK